MKTTDWLIQTNPKRIAKMTDDEFIKFYNDILGPMNKEWDKRTKAKREVMKEAFKQGDTVICKSDDPRLPKGVWEIMKVNQVRAKCKNKETGKLWNLTLTSLELYDTTEIFTSLTK